MSPLTKQGQAEFVRRCRWMAEKRGERSRHHPAKFSHHPWSDLLIVWGPDEDYLVVRFLDRDRKPENQQWSMVVEVFRGESHWGWVRKVPDLLLRLRKEMVLEDLSGV